jgi:hypothetical protein
MTITNEEGEEEGALTYERQDFWETTSNKQLNFLQHIVTMLKVTAKPPWCCRTTCCSKAAPARRSAASCWKHCDVHTMLRLPTGIFYAQGVKANVLFFDAKPKDGAVQTKGCGSTTCAPTSTSRSRPGRSSRRPARISSPATTRKTGTSAGNRALPVLQLRRPDRPRQGQPGYLLAQGRQPGQPGRSAAAGCAAAGDHRASGSPTSYQAAPPRD